MQAADWIVQPLGDRALLLAWGGEEISARQVAAVARRIRRAAPAWVQELVPAYRSIAVHIRMRIGGVSLLQASEDLLRALEGFDGAAEAADSKLVELPVHYGGDHGPDLEASAARSGMTVQQFIAIHSEAEYEVAMIGFAPGFPYLSGLPAELSQPRHETPRLSVPAGAVGIAGGQTGVYPVASPGGWQMIGRTTAKLFRPESDEPFLLVAGDRVKFVPIEDRSVALFHSSDAARPEAKRADDRKEALVVVKPGMLTTVQDLGRPGWQAYGVSVGGAMDAVAMRTANILVGNREDAAGLEITLLGPTFKVEQDLLVAISGADIEASADGESLPINKPILLRAGTTLSFGRVTGGCRAYLAVAGGIDVPLVMGSRSTDLRARIGGGRGAALVAGERLCAGQPTALSLALADCLLRGARSEERKWSTVPWSAASGIGQKRKPGRRTDIRLRVIAGAEWESFGDQARRTLLGSPYRVEASSDRMGIRLSGPFLSRLTDVELQSHGVVPGTIQVPQGGQPIVLAPGCQPSGGYPKLAHVITADLPLLAQLAPGDVVRFELTELEGAMQAREEQERDIALLQAGVFARIGE